MPPLRMAHKKRDMPCATCAMIVFGIPAIVAVGWLFLVVVFAAFGG